MHVYGPGVADVLIAPDVVQKLLPGKYLIGRGGQKVQKLQFFGGHIHGFPFIDHGIVGLINNQILVFHIFSRSLRSGGRSRGLETAEHRLDPGYQFLGVKGLNDIVVRPQLQPQHLVKYLPLGREHDNGEVGLVPDLPADLIAVDAGQHQIQKHQVGLKSFHFFQGFLSVIDNPALVALLRQIE